jgi:DNA-binding HxlR family transcriptional regulator
MIFRNPCPVAFTTQVMGGKWKCLRYSELRKACPPISDRILSKELKELEGFGLISRTEHAVVPPKTEYRLTDLGQTLEPLMAAMANWGLEHRAKIEDSSDDSRANQ